MTPFRTGDRQRVRRVLLGFWIGLSSAGASTASPLQGGGPSLDFQSLTPESGAVEFRSSLLEPRANPALPAPVRSKLTKGFRRALELLLQHPSCRDLFAELHTNPVRALHYSIYVPVRRGVETRICEKGAVAYTEVGSSVTRLCPEFSRLGERRAALTLIHEALHYAGQGEKPLDPDGLTSDQITRLVTRECR